VPWQTWYWKQIRHCDSNTLRKQIRHCDSNTLRKQIRHCDSNTLRKQIRHCDSNTLRKKRHTPKFNKICPPFLAINPHYLIVKIKNGQRTSHSCNIQTGLLLHKFLLSTLLLTTKIQALHIMLFVTLLTTIFTGHNDRTAVTVYLVRVTYLVLL